MNHSRRSGIHSGRVRSAGTLFARLIEVAPGGLANADRDILPQDRGVRAVRPAAVAAKHDLRRGGFAAYREHRPAVDYLEIVACQARDPECWWVRHFGF